MARKVSKRKIKTEKFDLELDKNNVIAIHQGPKRKNWSVLDIKAIKPLNEAQRSMIESYYSGNNIVAVGSAGTGKTYLSLWLALNSVLSKDMPQKKIIIVRSIVTTGKDLGALPGELSEKIAPFEIPYRDIINDLMDRPSSYDDLKDAGKIDFIPTTFVRGLTWDDAIVIVDEIQNLEFFELASVVTRIGVNTNLIMIGDGKQTDINYGSNKVKSGFDRFMIISRIMKNEFDIVEFTRDDIIRSKFVKAFICACEDSENM